MENRSPSLPLQEIRSSRHDAVETPSVEVYFLARECELFYLSITRRHESREVRKHVLPILENAVRLLQQRAYIEKLDGFLAELFAKDMQQVRTRAARNEEEKRTASMVQRLRDRYPQECDFFEVDTEFSYVWLKRQTKQLKKRHHPDRGGTHGTMLRINDIKAKFENFLLEDKDEISPNKPNEDLAMPKRPESANTFLGRLRALLLNIYIDNWDFEKSVALWRALDDKDWVIIWKDRENASKLALRLIGAFAKSGNDGTAHEVFTIFQAHIPLTLKVESDFIKTFQAAARAALEGKRVGARITHPIQAENARRHGLIDSVQHHTLHKRFIEEHHKEQVIVRELNKYREEIGFLSPLPTDGTDGKTNFVPKFVPYPRYSGVVRFCELQEPQQIEYHRAFRVGRLELIRKYTSVRLQSLLESCLLYDNSHSFEKVSRECYFLDYLQRQGTINDGALVVTLLKWLSDLTTAERARKLSIVRALNKKVTQDPESFRLDAQLGYRVRVSLQFIQTLKLPNFELQRILKGTFERPVASNVRLVRERQLQQEVSVIEKTKEGHGGYKRLFGAVGKAKVDPDGVINCLEPYVQDLLTLGQRVEHVELIDIGYWLNPLTIAYVRLERYEEARKWLDCYFSLPQRYLRNPESTLNKALRRRFEKMRSITEENS